MLSYLHMLELFQLEETDCLIFILENVQYYLHISTIQNIPALAIWSFTVLHYLSYLCLRHSLSSPVPSVCVGLGAFPFCGEELQTSFLPSVCSLLIMS